MRPEVLYISRNNVQYSTPGTSLFSFSFIGFPYLVLVYKDSISPSSVSFRTGIQAQVVEKFLKKALAIYPIRSYLSLGHGYSNDADDTYRGVPHMGYCKRSAPLTNKGEHMINDQDVKEWVEKCPEHDNEILHSDDNGIVICIRFNNEKEDPDEA